MFLVEFGGSEAPAMRRNEFPIRPCSLRDPKCDSCPSREGIASPDVCSGPADARARGSVAMSDCGQHSCLGLLVKVRNPDGSRHGVQSLRRKCRRGRKGIFRGYVCSRDSESWSMRRQPLIDSSFGSSTCWKFSMRSGDCHLHVVGWWICCLFHSEFRILRRAAWALD